MSKPTTKQSKSRSLLWAAVLLATTVALYLMTRDANQPSGNGNDGEDQNSISETADTSDWSHVLVQRSIKLVTTIDFESKRQV